VLFRGEPHTVALTRKRTGELQLMVEGTSALLQFQRSGGGALDVVWGAQRTVAQAHWHRDVCHVFTSQGATEITCVDVLAHAGESHTEGGRLTAPMPGKVVSFSVKPGDVVRKGQVLAVMEAMKMEHTIAAPLDGTVGELLFAPGDQVAEGAELLRLEV
jgi:3-methylcrotonyl-CoA carboxylase alpha subunit